MYRILYLISFMLVLANCTVKDANKTTPAVDERMVDYEISNAIDKMYSSINYDGEEQPDWDLMKSRFLEGAKMIPVTDSSYTRMSVNDFIELYRGQIESGLIKTATEYEIHHTGDQYQDIAQVFSTYETEVVTAEDTLRKRGINSIQLLNTEGEWKIVSLVWFDENDNYPIPSHYLDEQ